MGWATNGFVPREGWCGQWWVRSHYSDGASAEERGWCASTGLRRRAAGHDTTSNLFTRTDVLIIAWDCGLSRNTFWGCALCALCAQFRCDPVTDVLRLRDCGLKGVTEPIGSVLARRVMDDQKSGHDPFAAQIRDRPLTQPEMGGDLTGSDRAAIAKQV